MTSCVTATITCPQCGKEHPFKAWRSINVSLNPEMKAAVMDRSLFTFTCPDCGSQANVNYEVLYHDMENRILIYFAKSDEEAEKMYAVLTGKAIPEYGIGFPEYDYLIRIVMSQNRLREKIAIFDAGLDDRIVEICKLICREMFREEHGDNYDDLEVYFCMDPKSGPILEIIGDNEMQGYAELTDVFYGEVAGDYLSQLKDMRKDVPVIDLRWALAATEQ